MQRRTILRNIGTAAIGTVAVTGSASAASSDDYGIHREIDVSSIDGDVTMDELLAPEDIERLPDDVDPTAEVISVDKAADRIRLSSCCVCCENPENNDGMLCPPGCGCYRYENCS